MKVHVKGFQMDDDFPNDLFLDEDDWKNLSIYVTAAKVISDVSDVLESRNYPTGSSKILSILWIKSLLISPSSFRVQPFVCAFPISGSISKKLQILPQDQDNFLLGHRTLWRPRPIPSWSP